MEKKGQIGNTISYAPAPSPNIVSTDIPKYNGKVGKKDDWDIWVKTTEWYRYQYREK